MKKVLVAYFSRAGMNYAPGGCRNLAVGHTEEAAKAIAEALGCATFKIRPLKAYPEDYRLCTETAKDELMHDARPALATKPGEIPDFDDLFLGYPIWWGEAPMAVRTFLESADLRGKTVLPFCTHEGSGIGRSADIIQKAEPSARAFAGFAEEGTRTSASLRKITDWAKKTLEAL